jgi:hypothetical protein
VRDGDEFVLAHQVLDACASIALDNTVVDVRRASARA